jgi:hypothetical protein
MEQTALRAPRTTGATGWGAQGPGQTFERARSTKVGDGLDPDRRARSIGTEAEPLFMGLRVPEPGMRDFRDAYPRRVRRVFAYFLTARVKIRMVCLIYSGKSLQTRTTSAKSRSFTPPRIGSKMRSDLSEDHEGTTGGTNGLHVSPKSLFVITWGECEPVSKTGVPLRGTVGWNPISSAFGSNGRRPIGCDQGGRCQRVL